MQRGNGEWYICSGGVGRVSELLHRSRLDATQCDTIMTLTELMWPALSRLAYPFVVVCRRKCTTPFIPFLRLVAEAIITCGAAALSVAACGAPRTGDPHRIIE